MSAKTRKLLADAFRIASVCGRTAEAMTTRRARARARHGAVFDPFGGGDAAWRGRAAEAEHLREPRDEARTP